MIVRGGNRCTTRVLTLAGSSVPKMQHWEEQGQLWGGVKGRSHT